MTNFFGKPPKFPNKRVEHTLFTLDTITKEWHHFNFYSFEITNVSPNKVNELIDWIESNNLHHFRQACKGREAIVLCKDPRKEEIIRRNPVCVIHKYGYNIPMCYGGNDQKEG